MSFDSMRRAFLSTYCVLLSRFQLKFKVKPSLVFGACGGAPLGFLAGIFGIGGAARGLFSQPGYCPGFWMTNELHFGTIMCGVCTIENQIILALESIPPAEREGLLPLSITLQTSKNLLRWPMCLMLCGSQVRLTLVR